MLTPDLYRGVIAYPPTPFTDNFALDEEALRSNLRKLIRCGVDGIALAGTSGEFYTLSLQEIRRIAVILREETKGTKVYSIMGAVGLSTDDAITRGRISMEEGIDAILVIQPYYTPLTPEELLRFWEQLCPTPWISTGNLPTCPTLLEVRRHTGISTSGARCIKKGRWLI